VCACSWGARSARRNESNAIRATVRFTVLWNNNDNNNNSDTLSCVSRGNSHARTSGSDLGRTSARVDDNRALRRIKRVLIKYGVRIDSVNKTNYLHCFEDENIINALNTIDNTAISMVLKNNTQAENELSNKTFVFRISIGYACSTV